MVEPHEAVFLLLFVPWIVGTITEHTFGGALHALLALATILVLTRVVQGENPLGS